MKVVYKYQLELGVNDILLPQEAEILKVDIQHGYTVMWALVDDLMGSTPRRIMIVGTGSGIQTDETFTMKFINTFTNDNKTLVFHAFEIIPNAPNNQ